MSALTDALDHYRADIRLAAYYETHGTWADGKLESARLHERTSRQFVIAVAQQAVDDVLREPEREVHATIEPLDVECYDCGVDVSEQCRDLTTADPIGAFHLVRLMTAIDANR